MYLLDTDICIGISHHRQTVKERFDILPSSSLYISVITQGELLVGVERAQVRSRALAQLESLFEKLQVLPLTPAVASAYALTREYLRKRGDIIGANDLWISAHALALDYTLVTNNEREYRRVPGLRIENWTK